jgi:phytoene dehydrogenase-like protein
MKTLEHTYDFVVIGGGLAGVCAAVTASRKNIKTALIQDRPVLGGNASTEIRVPPVGATQCNFAYSRETGIIEELFLNNLHRNPTWSPEGCQK